MAAIAQEQDGKLQQKKTTRAAGVAQQEAVLSKAMQTAGVPDDQREETIKVLRQKKWTSFDPSAETAYVPSEPRTINDPLGIYGNSELTKSSEDKTGPTVSSPCAAASVQSDDLVALKSLIERMLTRRSESSESFVANTPKDCESAQWTYYVKVLSALTAK